ncbi:MAG: MFS transporter [Bryobacterales bacterium]|nr:MFS transporter [Bryobacterales bacterium]
MTTAVQAPPTRVRNRVLAMGFFAAVITYLDRVCISAAAPAMTAELGLTQVQMGYVFASFALAYAIFEVPAGLVGDRIGQRKVMTRIVGGWSVFTALTGMVTAYWQLLATRFVFGAAEAGAFPTLARALARWFPVTERARANGVLWTGARLGGSLAPPIAAVLVARLGWRETFILFGVVGVVWCVWFWRSFRDDPAEHPDVNAAELSHIRSGMPAPKPRQRESAPWGRILGSGTLWALFAMYFCSAYGFYFFVTWLPTFLMREHGMTLERSGLMAALPLGAGALGCLAGGVLADWLAKRTGSVKWSRRGMGVCSFFLAAAGFGLASLSGSPVTAVLCLAVASGAHDLALPVAWATVTDVGGRFGGTTSGFMNTASSLSAMLSSVSAAWLAAAFGSFDAMLAVASGVYVVGGLLWLLIDPTRPIAEDT